MKKLNTKLTGIRAGQPNHLIVDFTTRFSNASQASVDFTVTANGNSPTGQTINLTSGIPQEVDYAGLDGKFTLEGSSVTFAGNVTWGGQVAIESEGGVIIALNS